MPPPAPPERNPVIVDVMVHVGSCCGHCSWSLGRVLNNVIIHVCGIFATLYLYENMLCLIICCAV